jgi:hypothetical protein
MTGAVLPRLLLPGPDKRHRPFPSPQPGRFALIQALPKVTNSL